ncbi:hypothetical protein BegalDRAFT_1330 [Beggiatoa alba B18LD]|uniref:DUF4154 domain-containing protein n=1 Tax=Beggiatoa alba B18LD TaxID=395493 RepID=I3CF33_9GAMM|nr:YfiR family protein [Beggiatoa alba]EIJ42226.1 hypothetical protein BegalDRAFT_1330 [Beggiatoa alba B18LD]
MPIHFFYRLLLASIFIGQVGISYADESKDEYTVKTAFIYNIVRMVEWPDDKQETQNPIYICLLGEDYFGESINALQRKMVRNRPLMIKKDITFNMVKTCHVLFISASEKQNLATIFNMVGSLPILTMSDVNAFAESGGIVNLWRDEERIKVEVNLSIAEKVNLKISARLLQLARVIQ